MNNNEFELSNEEMSKPPSNVTRKRNFKVPNTIENLNTYVKNTRRNNGRWKNVNNISEEHLVNIKKMESVSFTKEFAKLILNAKLREYNLSLAKQRGRPNLSRLKYQVTERFRQAHAEGVKAFNILLEKRKNLLSNTEILDHDKILKRDKILKGVLTLISLVKKSISYIKGHIESIEKKY